MALPLVLAGCTQPRGGAVSTPRTAPLQRITIAPDNQHFVTSPAGERFTPWGFNYDRDHNMRLLEEYWDVEWDTVEADFREIKQLGANVVRIHLQVGSFMNGPREPNAQAIRQLKRLVRLAETTGLYLDITGLACYRKSAVPPWYDALSETDRWEVQARFWEAVAQACRNSPAVFCYDLINEPVAPRQPRQPGDWLVGEFGGFWYVQAITLDARGRAPEILARNWISQMTSAIRKHDKGHLITLGFLPNSLERPVSGSGFPPAKVAGPLDFICVHLYPKAGRIAEEIELLKGFNLGKPVVIEEIFPLECGKEEFRDFLLRSREHAAGWIGFYWGQTPAELKKLDGLGPALTLRWLEVFQELNPHQGAPR